MSQLKSEFLNIMQERGFYNQCTNLEGFDEYLLDCEKKGAPAVHKTKVQLCYVKADRRLRLTHILK